MRGPNLLLLLTIAATATGQSPSAAPRTAPAMVPAVVERHCGECHVGADAERGFDIHALFAPGNEGASASDHIALAVQRLRARTMPPPDVDQPSDEERRAVITALARLVPSAAGERIATVRRLTSRQYEHTVGDLFGITWRARGLLPEDSSAHGFDAQGDAQSVSPLVFEKYLDAADSVATAVLADPAASAALFDAPLRETLPILLARAYRRPVTASEVAERLADFDGLRATGLAIDAARHALLTMMLTAPAFVFRAEFGRVEAPAWLSAHELAVRLAYMLTSSMPDAELSARADDDSLLDPGVLAAEARRLASAHARRLAEDFAAQWLGLRDVLTANADYRRYPQIWNKKLRPAFYQEAVHFFAAIVAEDRRVLELLDADYTFVDATLAEHYALANVSRDTKGFERIALDDRRRGGLLGMGAMLMPSSYPLRTSPVRRGKWILEKLLDAPPPPPPPDAGVLPADDKQPDNLTVRQRLERHRRERRCASCHLQMDALGFALENYDVVGLWRDDNHGMPIDALAELPDGTELDGPIALKAELLRRADDFVRAMAKNLLIYAVGREMTLADESAIADIVAATRSDGDRFSALLTAVVTSPLFRMRDPGAPR